MNYTSVHCEWNIFFTASTNDRQMKISDSMAEGMLNLRI